MDAEEIAAMLATEETDMPMEWMDSDSDSDSDSFEEDLVEFEDRVVPKNSGFYSVVNQFDDFQFMEHFRVSRKIAEEIASKFEGSSFYKPDKGRNGKITSMQQTMIFLWFAGHQTASFRDVADRFGISISSLHRVSRRLIFFLSEMSKEVVTWPSEEEKIQISQAFRQKGFPEVIGCIDGTHIRIDTPSVDAMSYFNRKKFYSIQLQATCDDRMKITSILVGFPGSVHDARVYRRSPLGRHTQEKCGQYIILGDSAYPASRNLVTPFKETGNLTQRHRAFNKRHSQCRCVIEHCFGLLKQKFRQLYHCKLRDIKTIVHFIRACCVLHNLAIEDQFPEDPAEEEISGGGGQNNVDITVDRDDEPDAPEGVAFRDYLLATNFFR